MSEPVPFQFENAPIRVIDIDGEPWFIAADIAQALDYREASSATRTVREHQKGPHIVRTPGGIQQVSVISEGGLYRLVLRSRSEKAVAFQDWVTDEVLPAIRQTGNYEASAPSVPEDLLPMSFAVNQIRHMYGLRLNTHQLYGMLRLAGALRQDGAPRASWAHCLLRENATTSDALLVHKRYLGEVVSAISTTCLQAQQDGIQLQLPYGGGK